MAFELLCGHMLGWREEVSHPFLREDLDLESNCLLGFLGLET